MKDSVTTHPSLLGQSHFHTRQLVLMISVSAIFHGLLFMGMLWLQHYKPERRILPNVIDVNLVALPELAPQPEKQSAQPPPPKAETRKPKAQPKKPPPKPKPPKETVAVKKKPKAVSIPDKPERKPPAPVAKKKHSLKRKTFKSSTVVQNALSQIEEQVEESPPDPLQESLERLKRQVSEMESTKKTSQKAAQPAAGKGNATASASLAGEKGKKILDQIKLYQIEIAFKVQRNWAFSEQLAGGQSDMTAELAFNVLPSGEIKDIWFDKRSGNAYLDESARKAIVKSNPVDPHPTGINKPHITVGLRFGPEGLR